MISKITVSDLYAKKSAGQKLAAVCCYDYTTAKLVAQCDVDMVLVGDSAAQAMLGFDSTLPATMDFMVAITAGVRRGAPQCCLMADMPFLSYHLGIADALRNAGRFMTESGADLIKLEVTEGDIETVRAMTNAGIPVMAHIGIRPQKVALEGKLKAEGTTAESAVGLIKLATRMIAAGARALLVEGTAVEVARIITQRSPVPVIGIGSGPYCDGQILVMPDILGLSQNHKPKFVKSFGSVGQEYLKAINSYVQQVRSSEFPDHDHSYHLKQGESQRLDELMTK